MTGEEIARELISTLSVQYNDCASTNNVALKTLKVVYPTVVDVGCISHTLDLVGEKFTTPNLNECSTWWVSLFSHSPNQGSSALEGANRPANAWIFSYQMVEQMGANKASNGAVWGC